MIHEEWRPGASAVQRWAWVLLAWVGGVALQLQQAQLWGQRVYPLFCLSALVFIGFYASKRIAKRPHWSVLAVALALMGLGSTGWRAQHFARQGLDAALEGRDLDVVGVVQGLPQVQLGGVRFRLQVEQAWLQDKPVRLPPLVDVGWWSGAAPAGEQGWELQRAAPAVAAGERWQLRLRPKAVHGQLNPNGFDLELWAWEQGVQAQASVRAGARDPAPRRLQATWRHPVDQARAWVRARIQQAVPDAQAAALLVALSVGDQAALSRTDWDVFRATGTAHLVSISGLHVTLFAWGATLLLGWGWRRLPGAAERLATPTVASWGGVALAAAYAVFAGWGVPAQRTVLMLAVVAAVRHAGLRWPWPLVWLFTLALVLAWDPWALLQPGFWLSFVAVGILFATKKEATEPYSTRAMSHFYSLFREQWVVFVGLAPLGVLLFGRLSVAGLVANLGAIPWVSFVLTPLSLLGVAWPPLWGLGQDAARLFLDAMGWAAQWPGGQWWWPRPPLWWGAWACIGALGLVLPWGWGPRALAITWLVPVALWRPAVPAPGGFELLALDVGQGTAVLVRTATRTLLFDTGPRWGPESDAGHRVVVPLLQALQWPPDALVLSHRDSDHVGGAPALAALAPEAVWWTSVDATEVAGMGFGGVPQRCLAGQGWEWDGVRFEFLHPEPADFERGRTKPNALSCVLRVGNGRQTALLTGDLERAQEQRLVQQQPGALAADLLLVPHHGSKTSSSAEFLQAVRPRHAWVQSGYRNRYGHPAAPVLQRYREQGIALYDTVHCGALHWRSAAPDTVHCERAATARYWRHQAP
ncbi:MAG: ComEC/Rec2 family competence protein [Rhodoferax sp.]